MLFKSSANCGFLNPVNLIFFLFAAPLVVIIWRFFIANSMLSLYKGNSSVGDVTVTVEGKIIYITIDFKESVKVATAKDLAIKSLDTIGEKNLTFYDVQYLLTYSGTEENKNFPVFGSKSAKSLKVVWWAYEG